MVPPKGYARMEQSNGYGVCKSTSGGRHIRERLGSLLTRRLTTKSPTQPIHQLRASRRQGYSILSKAHYSLGLQEAGYLGQRWNSRWYRARSRHFWTRRLGKSWVPSNFVQSAPILPVQHPGAVVLSAFDQTFWILSTRLLRASANWDCRDRRLFSSKHSAQYDERGVGRSDSLKNF